MKSAQVRTEAAGLLAVVLVLGLDAARLGLVRQLLHARLLRLHLVDRLHQHALVLELVALAPVVGCGPFAGVGLVGWVG